VIPRYSRPEMASLWDDDHRYARWLDVEVAVCKAMAERGQIPQEAMEAIAKAEPPSAAEVVEIEKVTRHDVIAFLTAVETQIGDAARWVHLGLTSSDVLDTAFALLLVEAADLLLQGVDGLLAALKRRALEFKDTPTVGRSHGVHAEPITYGLALASFHAEVARDRERLVRARETVRVGQASGAVGTFANVDPEVEARACELLGLQPDPISTQIVQRDRHAEYFCALAVLAGTVERIALDVRHRMRTEVAEVREAFKKGQKGSSAMPHKRNPILTENITGLARLVRSTVIPALENQPLWHERDISHSSVERVIAPEATIVMDFLLARMTRVVDELVVDAERMEANLNASGGLIYSQGVLLELARKGLSRQQAYVMVQRNAMKAADEGFPFLDALLSDEELAKHLTPEEIEQCLDLKHHLRHVDTIFKRVFE